LTNGRKSLPALLYAQVVKTTRRRRLVRVSHRVVFGTFEAVQQVLAACGWQINTAYAGLAPMPRQSGTSVWHRPTIGHTGNGRLRTAFYMATLSAAQHNPLIKAFYTRFRTAGGSVSKVDIDGNNILQIKAIGVVISTFETLPNIATSHIKEEGARIHQRKRRKWGVRKGMAGWRCLAPYPDTILQQRYNIFTVSL